MNTQDELLLKIAEKLDIDITDYKMILNYNLPIYNTTCSKCGFNKIGIKEIIYNEKYEFLVRIECIKCYDNNELWINKNNVKIINPHIQLRTILKKGDLEII